MIKRAFIIILLFTRFFIQTGFSESAKTIIHPADGAMMVLIPDGMFLMGDNQGWKEAQPEHEAALQSFYIDQCEVSIGRYLAFIESGAYSNIDLWDSEIARNLYAEKNLKPIHLDLYKNLDPDLAVFYIRHFEAAAYCHWAKKQLPTSMQWEKAARGRDGRKYPWGDEWRSENANVAQLDSEGRLIVLSETPARTTDFSQGQSPYGVMQLSGNVWEWMREKMAPYPGLADAFRFYPPFEGIDTPELRGGSWTLDARFSTTSFRTFNYKDIGEKTYGFRCVCENVGELDAELLRLKKDFSQPEE